MSDVRRTLPDVYEAYRTDPKFDHLRTTGIVLVPGEGSSQPNIFIVGEAPGAMENTHKRPFVGASGQVLRSLITDVAGIAERDYFITNLLKYRPPGNRNPTTEEFDASLPYLRQEYSAVGSPAVLIAVGGFAFAALRPRDDTRGILSAAGKPLSMPRSVRVLWPMVHPAYALRNSDFRPTMDKHWNDFGIWYKENFR